MDNICIVCDAFCSFTEGYIFQMISKGCSLASQSNGILSVVCIGNVLEAEIQRFYDYGANIVCICNPGIVVPTDEAVHIIENILAGLPNLKLVMFPDTAIGQCIAARISNRIGAGLTAGCIDIKYEAGRYVYVRAALNSSVIANIITKNCDFGICTVKKNAMVLTVLHSSGKGVKKLFTYDEKKKVTNSIEILSRKQFMQQSYGLDEAKVIFGVGRGMNGKRQLKLLKEVACVFGAGIATTRPMVEYGFFSERQQVGQSGKNISPVVYIAFGISGACQHVVGIRNAKKIVAINTDPNAAIFEYADYKIVADGTEILEMMLTIKKRENII